MNTTGNPGFAAVSAVRSLLSDLTVPYWIIGGWAIGLAVGRVTREHADVDVMMLERDKGALWSDLTEVGAEPAGDAGEPTSGHPAAWQADGVTSGCRLALGAAASRYWSCAGAAAELRML